MEEEITSSPDEINSIAYLVKKRKFQAELLEMPLLKQQCVGRKLEFDSSYHSSAEPKKLEIGIFSAGGDSDVQYSKDSNSLQADADFIPVTCVDAKTRNKQPKTRPFNEPSTSSASWGCSNSDMGFDSTESQSSTKSTSHNAESLSTSGSNYEDDLLEFERHAEYILSEYGNNGMDTEKELLDLLCSKVVAPCNYVLSSGRWSVDQECVEEGSKNLTIDKEFEQYFSELML